MLHKVNICTSLIYMTQMQSADTQNGERCSHRLWQILKNANTTFLCFQFIKDATEINCKITVWPCNVLSSKTTKGKEHINLIQSLQKLCLHCSAATPSCEWWCLLHSQWSVKLLLNDSWPQRYWKEIQKCLHLFSAINSKRMMHSSHFPRCQHHQSKSSGNLIQTR